MKKLLLLFAVFAFIGQDSMAQLSTRSNYDSNMRIGTRPQAGDAALNFVLPIINLSEDNGSDAGLFKGNSLAAGDMLTFKYYHTDDIVLRVGLRLFADNSIFKGTGADSSDTNPVGPGEISEIKSKMTMREYKLALGAEKHFTNSNIFDVYGGGEFIIGLGRDRVLSNNTLYNGDLHDMSSSTGTTVFGVAGVVGFNVFVAELPVSLGIEYGWSAKWIFGGKTKVKSTDTIGGTTTEQEFTTVDGHVLNDGITDRQYSSFSGREFNMDNNHSVRINLNIYFGTKNN
jgi:hypothetical protein